ncbi:MAG: hypothetical protein ACYTFT_04445 [Planctomycetota bacterium]
MNELVEETPGIGPEPGCGYVMLTGFKALGLIVVGVAGLGFFGWCFGAGRIMEPAAIGGAAAVLTILYLVWARPRRQLRFAGWACGYLAVLGGLYFALAYADRGREHRLYCNLQSMQTDLLTSSSLAFKSHCPAEGGPSVFVFAEGWFGTYRHRLVIADGALFPRVLCTVPTGSKNEDGLLPNRKRGVLQDGLYWSMDGEIVGLALRDRLVAAYIWRKDRLRAEREEDNLDDAQRDSLHEANRRWLWKGRPEFEVSVRTPKGKAWVLPAQRGGPLRGDTFWSVPEATAAIAITAFTRKTRAPVGAAEAVEIREPTPFDGVVTAKAGDRVWKFPLRDDGVSELLVGDDLREAWRGAGAVALLWSSALGEMQLGSVRVPPSSLTLDKLPIEFKVAQYHRVHVPGSNGWLQLEIGDITGGTVVPLTLLTGDGQVVAAREDYRAGDGISFSLGEEKYRLEVVRGIDQLIQDEAELRLTPAADPVD